MLLALLSACTMLCSSSTTLNDSSIRLQHAEALINWMTQTNGVDRNVSIVASDTHGLGLVAAIPISAGSLIFGIPRHTALCSTVATSTFGKRVTDALQHVIAKVVDEEDGQDIDSTLVLALLLEKHRGEKSHWCVPPLLQGVNTP